MVTVRLYGLTDGYGSYAQVLRGFEQAFLSYGYASRLAVVSLESRPEDTPPGLPQADVAIFLGPPSLASAIEQHARHRVKCVMVMPNSDRLPEATMQAVNRHATHVLCPSDWAAAIVSRYTDKPILVTPLGVLPGFSIEENVEERADRLRRDYFRGAFRVLHLSSSTRERKGTLKLIKAWQGLRRTGLLEAQSQLTLVLVPEMRMQIIEMLSDQALAPADVGLVLENRLHGKGATPEQLARVYAEHHVLCQPSRGEAFGLTPLEALACGVPVVATQATGHSQWFQPGLPGAVPIPVGPYAEVDDLVGSRAPSVRSWQIGKALEAAQIAWPELALQAAKNAEQIQKLWSYEAALGALRSFLEYEIERMP